MHLTMRSVPASLHATCWPGLLIEGTFFGVAEAKFGIIDVVVEVITLGEGPWSVDKSDFSKGPDGWLGPAPPKGAKLALVIQFTP